MPLRDLPADALPREKLLARGPGALADAELLALLLRTGLPDLNVLQLADKLLSDFNGLPGLLRAQPRQLALIKGLGPAKQAEIGAVMEIARRTLAVELARSPVFDAPAKVKDYLSLRLSGLEHEVFAVLFLDSQHRLLCMEELFRGTLTQTCGDHQRNSFLCGSA